MFGRWRVDVLLSESQGADDRVAQVALVGVVAVDAETAAAQGADHFIKENALVLQDDVLAGLARRVDDQGELGLGPQVVADLHQGVVGCFVKTGCCGHSSSSPTYRQA
ncbi:hypothetical protein D3C81_1897780 [compost metagenome]